VFVNVSVNPKRFLQTKVSGNAALYMLRYLASVGGYTIFNHDKYSVYITLVTSVSSMKKEFTYCCVGWLFHSPNTSSWMRPIVNVPPSISTIPTGTCVPPYEVLY